MSIKLDVTRKLFYTYLGGLFSATAGSPIGTNVFERDWDVLAILDTCRVDALREVAPEYDWLPEDEIESVRSVGSNSPEWMMQTFTEEYADTIQDTAYIACNGYARRIFKEGYELEDRMTFHVGEWDTVSAEDIGEFHCVWDDVPVKQMGGHTDPQVTTDRGLDALDRDVDRLLIHYQRPHHPYNTKARTEKREQLREYEEEPFTALKSGEVDRDTIWDLYIEELRCVLDEVERLRRYVDGTVAISADHGEAFGEYWVHGHPMGVFHPTVRNVPWVTIDGLGENDPEIQNPLPDNAAREGQWVETSDQLRALGYVD